MIAPHELKNKTFSRVVRGYHQVEVDEYFDFLIEKYTEAYKANFELEQELNRIKAKYAELANEEESIRSAILKAQKLGEAIVNNAKKDVAAREEEFAKKCDQMLFETQKKVEEEKAKILELRKIALDFQHKLYGEYVKHLEAIRDMELDKMPSVDEVLSESEAIHSASDSKPEDETAVSVPSPVSSEESQEEK